MKKYIVTAQLSASKAFVGGLLYIRSSYCLRLAQVVIMMLLWRSLAEQGVDLGGFTLEQLLLYTMLSSILIEQLNITTPATTAFWEGSIISRYMRPAPVLLQLISETVGSWLPGLLLYSLPMVLIAPFLGLNLFLAFSGSAPAFLLSLSLSISLGFAFDFLFAALVIYLKNANYTAYVVRQAIIRIFSGALIPFALLPWGLGSVLELLPFGSIASAPLLIITGTDETVKLIALQLFWNAALWPLVLVAFKKGQERMVSYGG